MSNIYRYAKPPIMHFQIPQAIIPKLVYMKLDELRLLMFMHSEFQRTSKSEVTLPANTISRLTGIHTTNLGIARDSLTTQSLLMFRKVGKVFTYILIDPATKQPVPDATTQNYRINFDDVTADVLRRYFEPHLKLCKTTDNGLKGCCPFPTHDDTTPSFSVELKTGNGGRWSCFGCHKSGKLVDYEVHRSEDSKGVTIDRTEAHRRVVDRLRVLGVTESTTGHLEDVVFRYLDEFGEVNSEVVRPGGRKKDMYSRRPNPDVDGKFLSNLNGCRNLLYWLPEVMEADTVLIVEGEVDVETLRKLHLKDATGRAVAITTNPRGAGNWLSEHSAFLVNKWVILMGDTDVKGINHMNDVKTSLYGKVRDLNRVELPSEYRDVSHFLETHSTKDLVEMIGEEWLEPITPI